MATKKKEPKIHKRGPEPLRLRQIALDNDGFLFGLDLDGYVWEYYDEKWRPLPMEIA
jgi:hypothetical protein